MAQEERGNKQPDDDSIESLLRQLGSDVDLDDIVREVLAQNNPAIEDTTGRLALPAGDNSSESSKLWLAQQLEEGASEPLTEEDQRRFGGLLELYTDDRLSIAYLRELPGQKIQLLAQHADRQDEIDPNLSNSEFVQALDALVNPRQPVRPTTQLRAVERAQAPEDDEVANELTARAYAIMPNPQVLNPFITRGEVRIVIHPGVYDQDPTGWQRNLDNGQARYEDANEQEDREMLEALEQKDTRFTPFVNRYYTAQGIATFCDARLATLDEDHPDRGLIQKQRQLAQDEMDYLWEAFDRGQLPQTKQPKRNTQPQIRRDTDDLTIPDHNTEELHSLEAHLERINTLPEFFVQVDRYVAEHVSNALLISRASTPELVARQDALIRMLDMIRKRVIAWKAEQNIDIKVINYHDYNYDRDHEGNDNGTKVIAITQADLDNFDEEQPGDIMRYFYKDQMRRAVLPGSDARAAARQTPERGIAIPTQQGGMPLVARGEDGKLYVTRRGMIFGGGLLLAGAGAVVTDRLTGGKTSDGARRTRTFFGNIWNAVFNHDTSGTTPGAAPTEAPTATSGDSGTPKPEWSDSQISDAERNAWQQSGIRDAAEVASDPNDAHAWTLIHEADDAKSKHPNDKTLGTVSEFPLTSNPDASGNEGWVLLAYSNDTYVPVGYYAASAGDVLKGGKGTPDDWGSIGVAGIETGREKIGAIMSDDPQIQAKYAPNPEQRGKGLNSQMDYFGKTKRALPGTDRGFATTARIDSGGNIMLPALQTQKLARIDTIRGVKDSNGVFIVIGVPLDTPKR